MIASVLKKHIETLLLEKIEVVQPLSGGDINAVYLIQTKAQQCVVKINTAAKYPKMFEAEARGLQELKKSETFYIPEVINFGDVGEHSFLLLQYINPGTKTRDFWTQFGVKLATLHQRAKEAFGFDKDNYIGSLPQYNEKRFSATDFYINQRLEPQFSLANKRGFAFSNLSGFYKQIESEIPDEPPSLIHGDLWSGNFMVNKNGMPSLIDPAVAYAPREMDIAMMHLFGGFDKEVFEIYNEVFSLTEGWKERIPLFQLYYVLVHLNLFGSSYYPRVKNVLKRYT